jgi:hypothetical protein
MPPRGVFVEFAEDGTARAKFNNVLITLKTAQAREYVAEQYQPLSRPLAELAGLAIINTIDIADPADPDTIWGFVTKESFRFNGRYET